MLKPQHFKFFQADSIIKGQLQFTHQGIGPGVSFPSLKKATDHNIEHIWVPFNGKYKSII